MIKINAIVTIQNDLKPPTRKQYFSHYLFCILTCIHFKKASSRKIPLLEPEQELNETN
jgi:hypothetical protein